MKDFKKVELKSFFNWFFENNIIIFDNVIILQFWYLYLCKIDYVLLRHV